MDIFDLGNSHLQSARGDHVHNGENGLLIGTGITITGSLSSGAALQNLLVALGYTDGTSP